MTAALDPVGLSVKQLINVQIDFNIHAGGILSVTPSELSTSPDYAGCRSCENGTALELPDEENGAAWRVTSSESPSFTDAIANEESACGGDDEQSEASRHSTMTCIGTDTPDQSDAVGGQELDDCEKLSLAEPADVAKQQCASVLCELHCAEDDAERFDSERSPCQGTSRCSDASSSVEKPARAPADAADRVHCTPVSKNSFSGSEACSFTSPAMAYSSTPIEQADASSVEVLTSCDTSDGTPARTLAVHTPAAVHVPMTVCAGEPVTPTTPRQMPTAPLLPPASDPQRMTLVLDLDGTLIASEDEPHASVPFDYCVDEERFVWLRPGLRRFLDSVRPHFEMVLFTAAGESWATSALQRIDPDRTIFDSRLHRDHTVSHDDWPWVKDLSRLGRDLARVVIVDDNPLMFMYQPDNALHVAAYDPLLTGHNDDVLEQVLDVLMHQVLIADDVREVLRNRKEPISAACMAARHAAAKAAASALHVAAAPRTAPAPGPQARKSAASPGVAAAVAASAASSPANTAPSAGDAPTKYSPADLVTPGRLSRRARRAAKQQQQQQQRSFAASLCTAASATESANADAGCNPTAAAPQPPLAERHRRAKSRRRRGAAAGGADANAGASAASLEAPSVGYTAPAAGAFLAVGANQRVTRVRGPKEATQAGAGQLPRPMLQQPEHQLKLKLKLLQLQRAEEQQEEEADRQGAGEAQADAQAGKCAAPEDQAPCEGGVTGHRPPATGATRAAAQGAAGDGVRSAALLVPRRLNAAAPSWPPKPGGKSPAAGAVATGSLVAGGAEASGKACRELGSAGEGQGVAPAGYGGAVVDTTDLRAAVGEEKPRQRGRRRRRAADVGSLVEGGVQSSRAAVRGPTLDVPPTGLDVVAAAAARRGLPGRE